MNLNSIKEYKKSLKLNQKQKEVLVGLLLGDGHLATQNGGRTYALKIEHSVKQRAYVDWLYELYKKWVRTPPQIKYREGEPFSYYFSTYAHGAFRFYGQQFYLNGKKVVPHLIGKLLTPLGLAIWFMDDGSLKSQRHKTFIIHAIGYEKRELEQLQSVLLGKFGIKTNLHRQKKIYWRLYVYSESAERFREHTEKYILPSMGYKLGNILV